MVKKYAIAIDLGATNLRVALVDVEGRKILHKISERTKISEGAEAITNQVVENVRKILRCNRIDLTKVLGIGIGAPGPLDLKMGGIKRAVNIPYEFVPLTEPLKEEFRLPTILLNDANAAALGEWVFGAGDIMKTDYLTFITISTGIGGGIIDGGRLITGVNGNAGEIGCMVVDYRGKLRCGCGRYGHWQAYSSGAGIPNYIRYLAEIGEVKIGKDSMLYRRSSGLKNLSAKLLYECAKGGDKASLEIVEKIAEINAAGVGQVINAYNPEVITFGGPIVLRNVELTLGKMMPKLNNYAVSRIPKVIPSPLGEDVVIYGALAALIISQQEERVSRKIRNTKVMALK